jgi:hypothetical protein
VATFSPAAGKTVKPFYLMAIFYIFIALKSNKNHPSIASPGYREHGMQSRLSHTEE